jgi:hypothetical protein
MCAMKNTTTIILFLSVLCAAGCSKEDPGGYDDPVIPVRLTGIEPVNVDNAGRYPFTAAEAVRKEAYMIGIRWITDNSAPGGNQSVTGFVEAGEQRYDDIAAGYTVRIYCNTVFNSRNPAGANVSQYFKEVNYLPAGIDRGYVLLVPPDAGSHSFRAEYTAVDGTVFSGNTDTIQFY